MIKFQTTLSLIKKTPLIVKSLAAYLLLICGFAFFTTQTAPPAAQVTEPVKHTISQSSQSEAKSSAPTRTEGLPVKIVANSVNIDLPILPGTYDTEKAEWTLSDKAAYFATMTTQPNDVDGSTFIYGHNLSYIFAPFEGIRPGDELQLHTDNNRIFSYSYSHDLSVTPDMTDILYAKTSKPELVVMTCEGIWSETRRLMFFEYKGVS